MAENMIATNLNMMISYKFLSVYLKNTWKVSFDPKRLKNIGVSLIINTTKNSS